MSSRLANVLVSTALATAAGAALADAYTIDPMHTYPSFRAPHLGISMWGGKFNKTAGSVVYDAKARSGSVDIRIDAASVDFGLEKMNEHARKKDFFDVEAHPQITYKGKLVFTGDVPTAVEGELTMLGKTIAVPLQIKRFKCITHPMLKREVCGADVAGEFNRRDFGMTYGTRETADGLAQLMIQVEALKN